MDEKFPAVIPVIGLRLKIAAVQNIDPSVIEQLTDVVVNTNSLPTPDGWFVPLADLKSKIELVAGFLIQETAHFGEFEIGGGFLVLVKPGVSIEFPLSSNFRDAVNLANIVLGIEQGERRNFATGAQDFWTISTNGELTIAEFAKQGLSAPSLEIPLEPLRQEFRLAKELLVEFADELCTAVTRDTRWSIPPNQFRFMFGLDMIE